MAAKQEFESRFAKHKDELEWLFMELYHNREGLEVLEREMAEAYNARSAELKALDKARSADPEWYKRGNMFGMTMYTDLFAGNLKELAKKLPYLKEQKLTYLHLMPLLQMPHPHNDGGYAVEDFDTVDPALGTNKDLENLTRELRKAGISLCLDFVMNHTASTHRWAMAAKAGDPWFQAYYHLYEDRTIPDQYEQTVPQVFPNTAPGNFTWCEESNIPLGFFCYPVSQAADITAFKATTVPAGEDQEPMLEVTRELVRRFNQTYAPVLVEPEILLPEIACCRRLPGTDGKEKMSKSLGNCIYMSDDEKTVWKKVKKMSNGEPRMSMEEPGHLEGNAVFTYLEAFSTPEDFAEFWPEFKTLDELKEQYVKGGIGDGTCKKFLNSVINKMLDPIRARRHEFEQDIPEVFNILKKGSEDAREFAAQTMDEVRKAMRIDYFSDAAYIEEQAAKFKV